MLSGSGPVPSSLHHSWCCWTLILAPEWVRAVCNNPFGACLGTQMTFQHRQAPAVRAGAGLGEQYCLHGCQDARFFFFGNCIFPFAGLFCMQPFLYIFFLAFFSQGCIFLFVSPKSLSGFCGSLCLWSAVLLFMEEKEMFSRTRRCRAKLLGRHGTDVRAIDDDRALATT